jgi:hypothetical protein
MLTRKVSAVLATALIMLLTTASPAHAHGADAPDATNYKTTILGVPDQPGLEIITIEAGARLQLTNNTGQPVEVLGYQGEPYLEIRPDGVYENYHSPATYLNITIAHVDPPAHADPTLPPVWNKVSDDAMFRWHDQRTIWTEVNPPAFVDADPGSPHHIRDWTVPVRIGASALAVTGSLDYVPPPPAGLWWAFALALAIGIGALGLTAMPRWPIAALAILAGLIGLIYASAREVDAGNVTFWSILGQLFSAQLWTTITSLTVIAAGVYSLRAKEGDFALALGAAAAALFAGMANAATFHRSIVPLPWEAGPGRILTALVIGLAGGATIWAMVRLRGTAPIVDYDQDHAPSTTL